jgi:hypothetical protein
MIADPSNIYNVLNQDALSTINNIMRPMIANDIRFSERYDQEMLPFDYDEDAMFKIYDV